MPGFNQTMLSEFENALMSAGPAPMAPQAEVSDVQWALCGHLYENSAAQRITVNSQSFTIARHP